MNKLDGKCIVDREDLHTAVCYVRQAAFQHEQKGYGTHHALLDLIARLEEQALATNLTGWAAVPVMLTGSMFNNSRVDSPFMVTAPIGVVAQHKWLSILNASPPLPGGGE